MPTLLPSRAGLTTDCGPMRSATSRATCAASRCQVPRRNQVDSTTGSPCPRMRSLKTTLSMAMALASTPAPTYGMPASSRKPCSVPSSPNGPWTTRNATSMASASERTATRGATPPCAVAAGSCASWRPRRYPTSSAGVMAPRVPASDCEPSSGAGPVRQEPATVTIDVDEKRLEPIAIDCPQHGLGRRDADLVLCRSATGEDPDPKALLAHVPASLPVAVAQRSAAPQSPTNSIS